MNDRTEFFDSCADHWDSMECEDIADRLDRVVRESGVMPGVEILDVGTGTGAIIPHLLRAMADSGRILAIDISPGMLRTAKAKGFPSNVSFQLAAMEEFDCEDCSFDRVICNAVYPHFACKEEALSRIYQALRPGGLIVISHPTGREAVNKIHREAGSAVSEDRVPDANAMRAMLESAGFVDVTVTDEPDFYLALGKRPPA